MEQYYCKMSEDYRRKRYPRGSVLKEVAAGAGTKGSSVAGGILTEGAEFDKWYESLYDREGGISK